MFYFSSRLFFLQEWITPNDNVIVSMYHCSICYLIVGVKLLVAFLLRWQPLVGLDARGTTNGLTAVHVHIHVHAEFAHLFRAAIQNIKLVNILWQ